MSRLEPRMYSRNTDKATKAGLVLSMSPSRMQTNAFSGKRLLGAATDTVIPPQGPYDGGVMQYFRVTFKQFAPYKSACIGNCSFGFESSAASNDQLNVSIAAFRLELLNNLSLALLGLLPLLFLFFGLLAK